MINKKAENEILSPFLYFNMGLVGVTVIIGLIMFYSQSIDVRLEEAKILSDKISASFIDNGNFNEKVMEDNFNLLKNSGIDESIFFNGGYFYMKAEISTQNKTIKSFVNGTKDFDVQCSLDGNNFAQCYYKEFNLKNKSDSSQEIKVRLITGSNQIGSKV